MGSGHLPSGTDLVGGVVDVVRRYPRTILTVGATLIVLLCVAVLHHGFATTHQLHAQRHRQQQSHGDDRRMGDRSLRHSNHVMRRLHDDRYGAAASGGSFSEYGRGGVGSSLASSSAWDEHGSRGVSSYFGQQHERPYPSGKDTAIATTAPNGQDVYEGDEDDDVDDQEVGGGGLLSSNNNNPPQPASSFRRRRGRPLDIDARSANGFRHPPRHRQQPPWYAGGGHANSADAENDDAAAVATPAPVPWSAPSSVKKRFLILTGSDLGLQPATSSFGTWSGASVLAYAAHHQRNDNIDVKILDPQRYYHHKGKHYWRIPALLELLAGYEWALWLDADTVMTNFSIPLEELIEHVPADKSLVLRHVDIPGISEDINNGVFMIRNTPVSFKLLREWSRLPNQHGPFFDQSDLIVLLNYNGLISDTHDHAPPYIGRRFYDAVHVQRRDGLVLQHYGAKCSDCCSSRGERGFVEHYPGLCRPSWRHARRRFCGALEVGGISPGTVLSDAKKLFPDEADLRRFAFAARHCDTAVVEDHVEELGAALKKVEAQVESLQRLARPAIPQGRIPMAVHVPVTKARNRAVPAPVSVSSTHYYYEYSSSYDERGSDAPDVLRLQDRSDADRAKTRRAVDAQWRTEEQWLDRRVLGDDDCLTLARDFDRRLYNILRYDMHGNADHLEFVCALLAVWTDGGVAMSADVAWRVPAFRWLNLTGPALFFQEKDCTAAASKNETAAVLPWLFGAEAGNDCIAQALARITKRLVRFRARPQGSGGGDWFAKSRWLHSPDALESAHRDLSAAVAARGCFAAPSKSLRAKHVTLNVTVVGTDNRRDDDGVYEAPASSASSSGRVAVYTPHHTTRVPTNRSSPLRRALDAWAPRSGVLPRRFDRAILDETACLDLMRSARNFGARYIAHYRAIPVAVVRARWCGLLAVYANGGVYLDVDVLPGAALRAAARPPTDEPAAAPTSKPRAKTRPLTTADPGHPTTTTLTVTKSVRRLQEAAAADDNDDTTEAPLSVKATPQRRRLLARSRVGAAEAHEEDDSPDFPPPAVASSSDDDISDDDLVFTAAPPTPKPTPAGSSFDTVFAELHALLPPAHQRQRRWRPHYAAYSYRTPTPSPAPRRRRRSTIDNTTRAHGHILLGRHRRGQLAPWFFAARAKDAALGCMFRAFHALVAAERADIAVPNATNATMVREAEAAVQRLLGPTLWTNMAVGCRAPWAPSMSPPRMSRLLEHADASRSWPDDATDAAGYRDWRAGLRAPAIPRVVVTVDLTATSSSVSSARRRRWRSLKRVEAEYEHRLLGRRDCQRLARSLNVSDAFASAQAVEDGGDEIATAFCGVMALLVPHQQQRPDGGGGAPLGGGVFRDARVRHRARFSTWLRDRVAAHVVFASLPQDDHEHEQADSGDAAVVAPPRLSTAVFAAAPTVANHTTPGMGDTDDHDGAQGHPDPAVPDDHEEEDGDGAESGSGGAGLQRAAGLGRTDSARCLGSLLRHLVAAFTPQASRDDDAADDEPSHHRLQTRRAGGEGAEEDTSDAEEELPPRLMADGDETTPAAARGPSGLAALPPSISIADVEALFAAVVVSDCRPGAVSVDPVTAERELRRLRR